MAILITRGDGLITTAQAARLAGVQENTIRQWVTRGLLAKAGLDERGHSLFDPGAVARCELATRHKARRIPAPAA